MTVDPDAERAAPLDVVLRGEPISARQNKAAIQPVVGDELSEGFSHPPEDEMVQFDDWEHSGDSAIGSDP